MYSWFEERRRRDDKIGYALFILAIISIIVIYHYTGKEQSGLYAIPFLLTIIAWIFWFTTPEDRGKTFRLINTKRDFSFWFARGKSYLKNLEFKKALKCFDKVIEINPENSEAWYCKGDALIFIGRSEEAISCFGKSLKIHPNVPEVLYKKGVAMGNVGRFEEAIVCFNKVLELDPKKVESKLSKADALASIKKYDEALRILEQVLLSKPIYKEAKKLKKVIINKKKKNLGNRINGVGPSSLKSVKDNKVTRL